MIEVIEEFERIQAELTAVQPARARSWNPLGVDFTRLRGALLLGARGVGKTTYLLRMGGARRLYVSADHPLAMAHSLTSLVTASFAHGYEGVIIDEIHAAANWTAELKALYDANPRKSIWVSDSSSLVLRGRGADLSRRFPAFTMPFLSFREYLSLLANDVPSPWALLEPPAHALSLLQGVSPLASFRKHVAEGMRPFFLEGAYGPRLLATLEKSLFADVPFFLARVSENHLRMMNAAVALLARSPVPTLNIDALARDWALGKAKVHELLDVLEHAGVIHIVRAERDHATMSKGAKILLADPSLYSQLGGNLGTQREAYVVTMAKAVGAPVHASANERDGDFVIDGVLVEVGGPGKPRKKAMKVVRDDVEVPTSTIVPLWCLGFAY